MKLSDMTKDERSLLLYLETRAVDYGGRVDTTLMNRVEIEVAQAWNEKQFIKFGRIVMRHHNSQGTHWCKLSDEAFALAHEERRARAGRMWEKRPWLSTEENIDTHGIAAVRLGLTGGQRGEQPTVKPEDKATRGQA